MYAESHRYIVGDIQSDMSPVEVEGGEENMCHV